MGAFLPKLSRHAIEEYKTVTHFSSDELQEWYAIFMENYPDGKLTKEQFVSENTAAHGGDPVLWEYLFTQLDSDVDGVISFKEFIVSMDTSTRADASQKLRWTFTFFDKDKDGFICFDELLDLFTHIFRMIDTHSGGTTLPMDADTPLKRCRNLFEKMDQDRDGRLSIHEFIEGCRKDPTILEAMENKK